MKILVLNCGSSSLKYQLINMVNEKVLAQGLVERIGINGSILTQKVNGEKYIIEQPMENHKVAIGLVLNALVDKEHGVITDMSEINAVGHRVVHGGEKFRDAVLITEEVLKGIKDNEVLAPLHNPAAILGINACQKVVPNKPMVAVFDTAFHQTMSKEKYVYPIPYEYYEKYGIRKYGFHGTSHQYVANRVAEILGKDIKDLKIVNCHLGQGASICAIKNGESVETSMGLTPVGGIPMGTRSGDLDPSVVTYLMKKEKFDASEADNMLNKEAGVFGISMVSVDFRDIEAEALAGGKHAKLSLDAYHYSVAGYIAKCAVAMGGIDVITFTAGVGEKSPYSRSEICRQLEVFGVDISGKANLVKGEEIEISSKESKVKVFVVPTNEELMIAKETEKIVKKEGK